MSFCTFADGAAMFDATPIENMFLMEYMYDAPAPALKVYLYARMLALHPELGGTLADMAKALRMDEREVVEAFEYWERRELVCRLSDHPPTYALQSLRSAAPAAGGLLDQEMYANRDFNNSLRHLFGDHQFIGDHEIRKASDWHEILKFDKDAILRLVEYGIQTSRPMLANPPKLPKPPSVFKRMDRIAEAWSKRGIHTLEEVERAIDDEAYVTPTVSAVMKKLGLNRQPSDPELDAVRTWIREWGYTREEILDACDETLSARNPGFSYLNAILENRRGEDPAAFRELSEILRELNPQNSRPSPDQIKRYQALKRQNVSPEMIRQAAIQCHRANKYRFEDLEWRLKTWREEGIDTPGEAEAWMKQMTAYSNQLRRVFRVAGFDDRRPSYGEISAYRAWKDAYSDELIGYAAECSRNAGGSMAYMESLLSQWAASGVTTLEAAKAQHASRRAAASGKTPNPALDYAQRVYRDEDFGEDFFVDLSKYGEEERK